MGKDIRFTYFIRKDNGAVIAACSETDGAQHIYIFELDGKVLEKNEAGFWSQLNPRQSEKIRSLASFNLQCLQS